MNDSQDELSKIGESLPSIKVLEIELGLPLPNIMCNGNGEKLSYQKALILTRLHSFPLGLLELKVSDGAISPTQLSTKIWSQFSKQINQHLVSDGLPEVNSMPLQGFELDTKCKCLFPRRAIQRNAPLVSIVISTHERVQSLVITMESLLKLNYPRYEIILVDNAPTTNSTLEFFTQIQERFSRKKIRVRYLREDLPGLGLAHNRSLEIARGDIVAFTDDDVIVDRYWLAELVQGFQVAPSVGCVTGLVLPAELDTPAQVLFEEFGGFTKGFSQQIYDLKDHRPASPLFPYAAGQFGTGANMAFDTNFLRMTGGFDPALGIGTPALGADDMSAFYQAIVMGKKLVYQPSALVFHQHRRTYEGLRKQMYGYGVGLTAFLTKCVIDHPKALFELVSRVPAGINYTLDPYSPKNHNKARHYPKELEWIERKGMLYGPIAYVISRRKYRKFRKIKHSEPSNEADQNPHYIVDDSTTEYPEK